MKKEKIFNPNVQTFQLRPTQEAQKATHFINMYLYWMTNHSCEEYFHNAFGPVLGNHFWNKLISEREKYGIFGGDMHFWFEMSDNNRDILMNYLIKSGYN